MRNITRELEVPYEAKVIPGPSGMPYDGLMDNQI